MPTLTPEASLDQMMKHSKAALTTEIKPRLSSVIGLRHKPVTSNHQTETVSHAVSLESASTRHVKPIDSVHPSWCSIDFISSFLTENNGLSSAMGGRDFLITQGKQEIRGCMSISIFFLFVCLFDVLCNHFSTDEATAPLKEILSVWSFFSNFGK